MTLLTTVFAALFCTVQWYKHALNDEMKLGTLSLFYWGASLMWFVDAAFEYAEIGAAFFTPSPAEMLNDLYLGLSAIALGLIIWLVYLLIHDPKGIIRKLQSKD